MKMKNKAFALLAAAAVAVSSFAGAVHVSAYTADRAAQEGVSQVLGAAGLYSVSPNKTIVYSQLPSDDKMIGFSWADFGINTSETIEKVEIEISTSSSSIGKWQGAFGTSTSSAPDYWAQSDDMEQTISGNSGTITWELDSSVGSIVQTQYGGELKWGIWWVDCGTITVDTINVYTDAYTGGSSGNTGNTGNTGSTSSGGYTIKPAQTIVYSQLPTDDKMIGWEWSEFGIGTDEKIQKVEINISTPGSTIGKWQGAFGSSTTQSPEYWTQTDDMEQSISGKSGTITWNVDSATSAIIQTQYGGELKWGIWWIDCGTITVDSITVYTDKSGSAATTTTTTTTTKTTTTTTKTTTTTTKTTTSKTTTTATTTKITSDTVPAGDMYVQMAGRAADGESLYIPAGELGANIGIEFYNAEKEMLTMRGKYKLSDALAEIATPVVSGSGANAWIEVYDFAFGDEIWAVAPESLVFAANSMDPSENVFADGELVFGALYDFADAATIKSVAEKYSITAQQADDGTWYYAFPIHLDTTFDGWEWVGEDEVNVYPNGLKLVETSYIYVEAEPAGVTTTSTTGTTTTTTTTTTTKTTASSDNEWNDLIGDVNLDGKVGIQDIIRLNKYIAKIVTLNEQALRNAECCSDGAINGSDLTALMSYLVDKVASLPVASV